MPSIVPNSTVSAQAVSTPCSESVNPPVYTPAYTPVYTPSVPSSKPVPVYSVASKPATSQAAPAYTPQAPSSKPAPKPQPTGGYASTGRIITNGNKWAVTYTPYASDGSCKSADDIKADIKKISDLGFTTIRSYSTDCGVSSMLSLHANSTISRSSTASTSTPTAKDHSPTTPTLNSPTSRTTRPRTMSP